MPTSDTEPGRLARRVFGETLEAMDAGRAVSRAVRARRGRLEIFGDEFDLTAEGPNIYSVAAGKAAGPMASALDRVLGARLAGGVVTAPPLAAPLSDVWRVFEGGHPLPNEASLAAARACFDLLERADAESALVVFLVSGGGSAMLEWPRAAGTTLAELREANRALVNCGASIAEVNAVRRAFSAVKGGGLARRAPRAAQVTLVVSDTRGGEEHAVASGPTLPPPSGDDSPDALEVIKSYNLAARLPAGIVEAIERRGREVTAGRRGTPESAGAAGPLRRHHVLLDGERAVGHAAEVARSLGCSVEIARDISDQPVGEGASLLVSRLLALRERAGVGGLACLVSGGEFACPVRGAGVGGRSAETALRCALELEARGVATDGDGPPRVAILCAGTDGADGNSPAAGALCDETTARRARALGLDPPRSLEESDAYNFFAALGDALVTGPTGTNVRDLRILLSRKSEKP